MLAGLLWAVEFLLESSGALFAFRRRLQPLSILLGFRAFADILTFFLRGNAYGYAWWACYAVQLVLLCWLASALAGKLLRTHKRLLRLGVFASVLGGIVVGFVFTGSETWSTKFLYSQISASCWLALVVCTSWFSQAGKLERPWNLIAAGLLTSVGGNALCAWLWQVIPQAQYWYPVPAIAALLIWNWAAFSAWRLDEARGPQDITGPQADSWEAKKKAPTSVWYPRKIQARKM